MRTCCGVTLSFLLISALALRTSAEDAPPAPSAPAPISLAKAGAALTMDGRLDEPDWKRAAASDVNWLHGKKGVASTEPRMTARYLWDDNYLYIGYEVFDTNLIAQASGSIQGPPANRRPGCHIWVDPPAPQVDVVEFFVTLGDTNLFWEIHHNASNQFNDVLVVTGLPHWKKAKAAAIPWDIYFGHEEFIQDEEVYRLACATAMTPRKDGKPSTVNDESDLDVGYTGEIRLPWYGLFAPASARTRIEVEPATETKRAVTRAGPWKMAGLDIHILAVFQNGDIKDRYHHSGPDFSGGWFHMNVPGYPVYRMTAE